MTKLTQQEKQNWYLYCIPGQNGLSRMKVNVIHLSVANSKEHELAKCSMAYDLMKDGEKVLTEAQEIKTGLRRDLVSISTEEIYEFEDSTSKRGHRHPRTINVFWYDLNRMRTKEEALLDDKNTQS